MSINRKIVFPIVFSLLCLLAAEARAEGNSEAGTPAALQMLTNTAQDMNRRLSHMESLLETLVRPEWEYKVVVPNMMNTSNMGDQILDGINLDKLGKNGWELVGYTDNYGFIFKRRRME